MSIVYTVANQKGGVGKTTTAQAISEGLSKFGFAVLMVDADPQCNLSSQYLTQDDAQGKNTYTLLRGGVKAEDAIFQIDDNLFILPAVKDLALADSEMMSNIGYHARLKKKLACVHDKFDFIIIDTPPSLNGVTINALVASNSIIVPSDPSEFSIDGLKSLSETIAQVKDELNPALFIRGILFTRYSEQKLLDRGMWKRCDNLTEQLDTHIFSTHIRECKAIGEAQARHECMYTYAPRRTGVHDYYNTVCEIIELEGLTPKIKFGLPALQAN